LRATDIVISISNSEALEIKRTFWKRVITCEVIENSVDCKALKQSMEGPMNPVIESFFKLNQGRFIVTMIARYDKVKNYPLALDSCSSVLRQNADCAFLFVGINKQDDQFIQLNKEFPNRICGIDVKSSTSALIERSHVILLTSHKEGLPIVIQEAFCFAKPAVATNVAGINELVINDFNGTLCSENPDEIAANILRLIQDKSYYRQLCFGASKTAEKYDFKQWVMKYHRIYCL
jgi:glycosyltransferase involved in cell wall biosynthesis